MTVERVLAAIALAICVVLMLRLLMGRRRRLALDLAWQRTQLRLRRYALSLYRWRAARREAARVAEQAIRRAREGGSWEGNVYTPKSLRKPRKPH